MISQSLNGQESGQRAAGRGRGHTERLQVAKAGSLLLRSCPRVGKGPLFILGKFRSKRRVEQRNIHIIPECLGTKICGHSSFLCREPGCTGAPIPRAYTVFSFPDHVDSGRLLSLGLFPHLKNGDNNSTHGIGLLGELDELLYVRGWSSAPHVLNAVCVCVCVCVHAKSISHVQLSATPWTIAR